MVFILIVFTGSLLRYVADGRRIGMQDWFLKPYEDCKFFVSKNAGMSCGQDRNLAHQYDFSDQGGILVAVRDEDHLDIMYKIRDEEAREGAVGDSGPFFDTGTALRVTKDVGIDKTAAWVGVSPQGKEELIQRMQYQGPVVAMV